MCLCPSVCLCCVYLHISLIQCVSTFECASARECVFVSLSECLREPASVCLPECRCPGVYSVCRSTRSVLSGAGLCQWSHFHSPHILQILLLLKISNKNQQFLPPTPPRQAFTFEFEIRQTPSRFQDPPTYPAMNNR